METQSCFRCKKIGYCILNGGSVDDVKVILSEEPVLKVTTPYNSIAHLSGSRLGFSDSHIDAKSEALLTIELPKSVECRLYIEEKMDGSNCSVIRRDGNIIAVGRNGYACLDSTHEQHRRFAAYVAKRLDMFEKLLPNQDDRVVGEWLAQAHGTMYEDITDPYQVFDIFRGKKRLNYDDKKAALDAVGMTMVPLLYMGNESVSIQEALRLARAHNDLTEGVVYRLEVLNKKLNEYVPTIVAKVVRMDKEDGKYLIKDNPVWMWQE